jgi:RHS repeat-associated protein
MIQDKGAQEQNGRPIAQVGDADGGHSSQRANWFAAACLGLMFLAAAFKKQRVALRALASFLIVTLISCSCTKPIAKDTLFYGDNHLGSATLLTDADGKVVGESNFDIWGNGLVSTDEPYGFIGTEYDAEAGLQYLNARSCDVRLGRFISPDLSLLAGADMGQEDPQSLNLYSYARNTPTSLRDKSGKLPHIIIGALVGGLIGGGVYLAKAYFNGEQANWKSGLAAVAGGAVAGGLAAATGGASLVLSGGVAGAAGGIVERGIETGSVHSWSLVSPGLVDITVESAGKREVISATSEHPFLRSDGQYIEARLLKVGDSMTSVNRAPVTVVETAQRGGNVRVFNFEVAGVRTGVVSTMTTASGVSVFPQVQLEKIIVKTTHPCTLQPM